MIDSPENDELSYDGAHRLAAKIAEFWARKGMEVRTWVVSSQGPTPRSICWAVRSDLPVKLVQHVKKA